LPYYDFVENYDIAKEEGDLTDPQDKQAARLHDKACKAIDKLDSLLNEISYQLSNLNTKNKKK
jgi:predicted transcriptional regulator